MGFGRRYRLATNISLVLVVLALSRLGERLIADRAAIAALAIVVLMALQTLAFAEAGQSRGDVSLTRLLRVLSARAIGLVVVSLLAAGSYELQCLFILNDWGVRGNLVWLLVPVLFSALLDTALSRPYSDEYWALGKLFISRRWRLTATVKKDIASCVIKIFFYPMMFVYIEQYLDLLNQYWFSRSWTVGAVYDTLWVCCLIVDLVFGASGYALSLKILNNNVRSVNPYPLGWLVTIVCYSPFWAIAGYVLIFQWHTDWLVLTEDWPMVRLVWLAMIACCLIVYSWSTVELGTRFSNLTYRGTVTSGPYRLMKHPAYVSKVVSYWLITVPFIPLHGWVTAVQQCVVLAISCSIYYFRAKYEEKHLLHHPEYRDYAAKAIQH